MNIEDVLVGQIFSGCIDENCKLKNGHDKCSQFVVLKKEKDRLLVSPIIRGSLERIRSNDSYFNDIDGLTKVEFDNTEFVVNSKGINWVSVDKLKNLIGDKKITENKILEIYKNFQEFISKGHDGKKNLFFSEIDKSLIFSRIKGIKNPLNFENITPGEIKEFRKEASDFFSKLIQEHSNISVMSIDEQSQLKEETFRNDDQLGGEKKNEIEDLFSPLNLSISVDALQEIAKDWSEETKKSFFSNPTAMIMALVAANKISNDENVNIDGCKKELDTIKQTLSEEIKDEKNSKSNKENFQSFMNVCANKKINKNYKQKFSKKEKANKQDDFDKLKDSLKGVFSSLSSISKNSSSKFKKISLEKSEKIARIIIFKFFDWSHSINKKLNNLNKEWIDDKIKRRTKKINEDI
jgi:hypothetical protein